MFTRKHHLALISAVFIATPGIASATPLPITPLFELGDEVPVADGTFVRGTAQTTDRDGNLVVNLRTDLGSHTEVVTLLRAPGGNYELFARQSEFMDDTSVRFGFQSIYTDNSAIFLDINDNYYVRDSDVNTRHLFQNGDLPIDGADGLTLAQFGNGLRRTSDGSTIGTFGYTDDPGFGEEAIIKFNSDGSQEKIVQRGDVLIGGGAAVTDIFGFTEVFESNRLIVSVRNDDGKDGFYWYSSEVGYEELLIEGDEILPGVSIRPSPNGLSVIDGHLIFTRQATVESVDSARALFSLDLETGDIVEHARRGDVLERTEVPVSSLGTSFATAGNNNTFMTMHHLEHDFLSGEGPISALVEHRFDGSADTLVSPSDFSGDTQAGWIIQFDASEEGYAAFSRVEEVGGPLTTTVLYLVDPSGNVFEIAHSLNTFFDNAPVDFDFFSFEFLALQDDGLSFTAYWQDPTDESFVGKATGSLSTIYPRWLQIFPRRGRWR